LVPVAFSPLEEFEVILEFAFYETFDREGAINSALSEDVCRARLVGAHRRMERVLGGIGRVERDRFDGEKVMR